MFDEKRLWRAFVALSLLSMIALACSSPTTPIPRSAKEPASVPASVAAPTATAVVAARPAPALPTMAPAAIANPWKIGFVNSASGSMAPVGTLQRDTVLMLEEQVNNQAGIYGRPLKIIAYDDESDEAKGVVAVKTLINEDKVLGIIGTASNAIAMAQAPVAEDSRVPFVTMQSSKGTISPAKKWIFKLPLSEAFYVEGICQWLEDEGFTNFAWISQGAEFGRDAQKYLETAAALKGLTAVVKEEYGPTDTDMTSQLTRVKASPAQALVVYGAEAAGAIAVRQAKELGINIPVIGPESLIIPAMADPLVRNGLDGLYVLAHKGDVWEQLPESDAQKPVLKSLAADIRAKYGGNRTMSVWDGVASDAFNVIVRALRKGNPDPTKLEDIRSKVRNSLETVHDVVGATSTLTYSASDHEGGVDMKAGVVNQVKGGTFKLIKVLR